MNELLEFNEKIFDAIDKEIDELAELQEMAEHNNKPVVVLDCQSQMVALTKAKLIVMKILFPESTWNPSKNLAPNLLGAKFSPSFYKVIPSF